jgi:5'-3' exonuclease
MKVHLVDGTYELFRCYHGAPLMTGEDGCEVGATRGLLHTLVSLLGQQDVSHVACAFDTVIESFRNDLFAGYKTADGVPPELLSQFPLAERAAAALGVAVWGMVDFEADDALASGAARFASAPGVEQVVVCTPDKDLAQCVRGTQVVCLDRRRRRVLDEAGVVSKFGVSPSCIPDWLALVGDDADGIPGIPLWGHRSAAALLSRYGRIELIPDRESEWAVSVRGAAALAASLRERRAEAELYRGLATLRTDVPLREEVEDLRWLGARREPLEALCRQLGETELLDRVTRWRSGS